MLYYEKKAKKDGFRIVAGIDEAGRGPLAGPVVAAAAVLKNLHFKTRIDDSKKLSSAQREKAFSEIYENCFIGVGIVNELLIDIINIRRATFLACELAVNDLHLKPDYLLLDGAINLRLNIPEKTIIAGDSKSISIACASIVAKVTRDRIMHIYDHIYPKYGFARHKGYATSFHVGMLKKFDACPIHRRSFSYT